MCRSARGAVHLPLTEPACAVVAAVVGALARDPADD